MKKVKTTKAITRASIIALMATSLFSNMACTPKGVEQSIKTTYPTKDWVIADYVVTDPQFGAKAEPGFDNRAAFQAAIDSAYYNGGGVVYIPAGNYEFRSTQTGTRQVRVRQGKEETSKIFNYEYCHDYLKIFTTVL